MSNRNVWMLFMVIAVLFLPRAAMADVFNMGAGQTSLEFVTVGDPGNAGELSGAGAGGDGPDRICGAVDYTYQIGRYEVTNAQYAEFLNAVATVDDPHGLYNPSMGGGYNGIGGISRAGSGTIEDPWVYLPRAHRANRPVIYVTFWGASRFANWLHNGQLTGPQDLATTEDGAYSLNGVTNPPNTSIARNENARVWIPNEDEWYKAAYYKGGGTNADYWDYPTQSDVAPTTELPAGTDPVNGSVNCYSDTTGYLDPTYYISEVGSYTAKPSVSAYGTFDQGGNVWEWNEEIITTLWRGNRGASFSQLAINMHAAYRNFVGDPMYEEYAGVGFRVAAIPEPASLSLLAVGVLALLRSRRAGTQHK